MFIRIGLKIFRVLLVAEGFESAWVVLVDEHGNMSCVELWDFHLKAQNDLVDFAEAMADGASRPEGWVGD